MPQFSLAPVGSSIPTGTPEADVPVTPADTMPVSAVTPAPLGDALPDEGIPPAVEGKNPFADAPSDTGTPEGAPSGDAASALVPPTGVEPPAVAEEPLEATPASGKTTPADANPTSIRRENVVTPAASSVPDASAGNTPHAELTGPAKIVREAAPVVDAKSPPATTPAEVETMHPASEKIVRGAGPVLPPPGPETVVPQEAASPAPSSGDEGGMSVAEKIAIQQSIGGAHENVEGLRKEVRGAQASLATMAKSVQQILDEGQHNREELARLTSILTGAANPDEVRAIGEQLQTSQTRSSELQSRLERSETEIGELRAHIAQLESLLATVEELRARVEALPDTTQTVEELRSRVEALPEIIRSELPADITRVVADSMVLHVTFETPPGDTPVYTAQPSESPPAIQAVEVAEDQPAPQPPTAG